MLALARQADRWAAGLPDDASLGPTAAEVTGCIRALDPLPDRAGVALPLTWVGQVASDWEMRLESASMTEEQFAEWQALHAKAASADQAQARIRELEKELKESKAQARQMKKELRKLGEW